jgi:glucuronosyltransferase
MYLNYFIILFATCGYHEAKRILIVYPTISKSHIMPLQTLSLVLAEKGHDVTFMSTYPMNKNIKNYREIQIPFDESDKSFLNEVAKDPKGKGILYMLPRLAKLVFGLGNQTLQLEDVKKLKREKFDLLIAGYFMTDFMLGLGDHFKCPTILFSPAGAIGTLYESIGNPMGLNGYPHLLNTDKSMDFMGRVKNFGFASFEVLMSQYFKYRSKQVYE